MKKKLGLIVNPFAGIGGTVGLKGSDGEDIQKRAFELGAVPQSSKRAMDTLNSLISIKESVDIYTYPYGMGENEARQCGFDPIVIGEIANNKTTSKDTQEAAIRMLERGVDLILFAGGDGTARDIYQAVQDRTVVLGIPAGVKIHSGVYAKNPRSAAELARLYLQGQILGTTEMEVMDIDETAYREGRLSAKLYGFLKVPNEKRLTQNVKSPSQSDINVLESIAAQVIENMEPECMYLFGPGTTTRIILDKLGIKGTLLGIDAIQNRELLYGDINEHQILNFTERIKTKIVVTPIGGQGFIFGRGSQQLSAKVIQLVGKENIHIVATPSKLVSLSGCLWVDTGNHDVNQSLCGYIRVITGFKQEMICKVIS